MLVVKRRREMRWQLDGEVESRWEKGQNIYVLIRRMQERAREREREREEIQEGAGISRVRSLHRQEGTQAEAGLN